mmetsp:Transcript_2368/g.5463  ORF Transcript_2368/g.5463 Transcript_2368/m.5463 type:complete len:307 (-) Transcript_2368:702-1622(-)
MVTAAFLVLCAVATVLVSADDYTVAESHKSLLVAVGCFWCGEQAFEQYAPGVVEAVSGYAGGTNDNPTYKNHPGHYEVVLIEYDPTKTSYELLVEYAYRNLDPFDGNGQFCDKGASYHPAIFFATEEEQLRAEEVLAEILELYPDWSEESIKVPILERPKFWKAEEYHQDYYIKNPSNYGYYKNRCGRSQRLKEVWGEDQFKCYHDEDFTCWTDTTTNTTTTATTTLDGDYESDDESDSDSNGGIGPGGLATVKNENGEVVAAESNAKNAPAETSARLATWAKVVIAIVCGVVGLIGLLFGLSYYC